MSTDRDALAEVLAGHDDAVGWMWSDSDQMVYACECGDHYVAGPIDVIQEQDVLAAAAWHRGHVADALLASPQFASLIAEAEARGAARVMETLADPDFIGLVQTCYWASEETPDALRGIRAALAATRDTDQAEEAKNA